MVPRDWPENPQLGRWTRWQRQLKKGGKINPHRERMLNSIDFDWVMKKSLDGDRPQGTWHVLYDQLVAFRELNGHCDVPSRWAEDPKLGGWVSRQRRLMKSGRMDPDRERMLNDIGFTWCHSHENRIG
jgi:hypothetical protein